MKTKQRSFRKKRALRQEKTMAASTQSVDAQQAREKEKYGQELKTQVLQSEVVLYDENLLERARTQWQFGDWESLVSIDRETLQHHPDRAKLALLAAAGQVQQGDTHSARQFIRLAQDWGCSKKLISQVLIAGVYNSLGRAAVTNGQQYQAIKHFERATTIGNSSCQASLLSQARMELQLTQLGLQSTNKPSQLDHIKVASSPTVGTQSLTYCSEPLENIAKKTKEELKADVNAELKANLPLNPYGHNRTLTPALNKSLREFALKNLGREGLKTTYIDYLAVKAIQIERNCTGRLATTVQDAIARQLVAECVPGDQLCVLEIGALYGISLAILYNHAITRYQRVQVACLDPFDGYYGKAVDAVLNSPVNDSTFLRNMRLANVPQEDFSMIKFYSTDPAAIKAAQELPINLLIIDGDHSYEGVKFDHDNYFPLLKPGGYVIFDDYNAKEWPGVMQFIDQDLANTQGLEFLGAISRTAVARKKLEPAA